MSSFEKRAISVKPDKRQLAWHELEFYGFIHYGMNTFASKEWGDGSESPKLFNPSAQDAEQWAQTLKAAGMKGMILTSKHHEGFCLWPSKYTSHSVKNSPFKDGKGDVVAEAAKACDEAGLKFGIYLSPWDRNSVFYGDSPKYNEYFKNQLTELLTGYGELFSIWFDGACGEGPNGKVQQYDFKGYYELIRKYQPNAVISICGPDVRWCGNEEGRAREAEWSVVPASLPEIISHPNKTAPFDAQTEDLGSRKFLENEQDLIWYPAETDTSIRPGWFYKQSEDERVKDDKALVSLYENTVGGNSALLLNVPPDKRGLIASVDEGYLTAMGSVISNRYKDNLLKRASSVKDFDGLEIKHLIENDTRELFWAPGSGRPKGEIEISFSQPVCISRAVFRENIEMSQRIEGISIYARLEDKEVFIARAEVVGAKRILAFPQICSDKFTVKISGSRVYPTLAFLGLYR